MQVCECECSGERVGDSAAGGPSMLMGVRVGENACACVRVLIGVSAGEVACAGVYVLMGVSASLGESLGSRTRLCESVSLGVDGSTRAGVPMQSPNARPLNPSSCNASPAGGPLLRHSVAPPPSPQTAPPSPSRTRRRPTSPNAPEPLVCPGASLGWSRTSTLPPRASHPPSLSPRPPPSYSPPLRLLSAPSSFALK
eukprot:4408381-Pleurochrysis_carterae.AAC.4